MFFPSSSKNLFTYRLTLKLIFLIFLSFFNVSAQSRDNLASLYEQNRVELLKDYNLQNRIKVNDWRLFVRAIFIENIDMVMSLYTQIYTITNDKKLKGFIRERVADFYYAEGYYETSQKMLKDENFFRETISVKKELNLQFGIQTGAYGNYENALNTKNKLLNNINDVTIIKKESKGNDLFIVVIGRYQSRHEAERALKDLKQKSNLNGFIIQY